MAMPTVKTKQNKNSNNNNNKSPNLSDALEIFTPQAMYYFLATFLKSFPHVILHCS